MGLFDYTVNFIWEGFVQALTRFAQSIPAAVLGILVALFFIIVGWIIGGFAKKVLIEILKFGKLDELAKAHSLSDAVGGVHLSEIAGSFLKWYVILLFLQQAVEAVNLNSLRVFLQAMIYFIPILLFAMAIFILGLLLARFVRNKILATHHKYKSTLGGLSELIIIYLSLLLGLEKVGLNVDVLKNAFLIAFGAFVLVIAIIFGVSIALAFKKEARDIVDALKEEMKELK